MDELWIYIDKETKVSDRMINKANYSTFKLNTIGLKELKCYKVFKIYLITHEYSIR